jgi:peroxiredoxin
MIQTACRRWEVAAAWLLLAGTARAGDGAPDFPTDPSNWVNSAPVTVSALKGKAAVLLFYEGDCPQCRKAWPKLKTLSEKFKDDPVLFIGVNSGKPRSSVLEYVKTVGCSWPIIVDPTRTYENSAIGQQISLHNVIQIRLLTITGRMAYVDLHADLEAIVNAALEGAEWNIDPEEVPASLKSACLSVEFGNYPAAAGTVQKSLSSDDPAVKSAAEKLNAVIRKGVDSQFAQAQECLAKGKKWEAFQLCATLVDSYKGFELPPAVLETRTKLADDPTVKKELLAYRSLERIRNGMNNPRSTTRKQLVTSLEKLVKDRSDTIAGAEAKQLLAQINSSAGGGKK